MSPDEQEPDLAAENEELRGKIASLEKELKGIETQLKETLAQDASMEPPKKTAGSYLAWVFWMVMVACLGAYLYKILAGAGRPVPAPKAPVTRQRPVPVKKTPRSAPAEPEQPEPAETEAPAKLPGFTE